jgi:CRISPR type III-B/RAMP module-associated protein Cmr3
MMQAFELQPLDTLFFRDARPMQAGAGSGGHGANWPLPTTLHEAFRSMLLRQSGLLPSGKAFIGRRKRQDKEKPGIAEFATRAYESLRILGPFPVRDSMLYFPTPHDLAPITENNYAIMNPLDNPRGSTNYPTSWLRPVAAKARAGKSSKPGWTSKECFIQYLSSKEILELPQYSPLFYSENRIGIGIDPETQTAAKGKLFASEHMRLAEGVGLWAAASVNAADSAIVDGGVDIKNCLGQGLTFGGESRMCRIYESKCDLLDNIPEPQGTRIKWILTTPAVFSDGWRPNWIRPQDGAVMLRAGDIKRNQNEDRLAWRTRIRNLDKIAAKLVAVRTPGPRCFSGWDLNMKNNSNGETSNGGPKATVFAVPEGSVYYFEAENPEAAVHLVRALHGRTLSDYFGEKGMGLGFCGQWTPLA